MSREQLSVIDPALIDLDKKESTAGGPHQQMSLRVHMSSPFVSPPYSSSHARLVDVREFDSRRALHSPPPITTLDSPSPSVVDRSSTNTPHQRRSPPMGQAYYPNQQDLIQSSAPRQPAHFSSRGDPINQYQAYAFEHRFDHQHDRYPVPTHFVQHQQMHEPYGRQQYPVQGGQPPPVTIVHTDDASTKLTDGIRRRCFNCCTTDTSTWRRSNLSPGKVLCNKCGLFERTHSRPRPDQFPHKRGPLAASTLRGRTPPGLTHGASSHAHQAHTGSTQLPPIVGGYQYHHSNLTPLSAGGPEYPGAQAPLPGLQSWHNTSGSSSASAPGNGGGGGGGGGSHGNSAPGSNHGGSGHDGPGSGGNSASTSAHGTPLLPSRRPTLAMEAHQALPTQSPRMLPSGPANGGPAGSGHTIGSNGNGNSGNGIGNGGNGNGLSIGSGGGNGNGGGRGRYEDGLASNGAGGKGGLKEEESGASPLVRSGVLAKGEPSPDRD